MVAAHLGELLGAAMEVADVGHGLDDDLALDREADAQDAVSGRVLRAQIDEHLVRLEFPTVSLSGWTGALLIVAILDVA